MKFTDCRYDGSTQFSIAQTPTSAHIDKSLKEEYVELTRQNNERMGALQDKLYADGREGLVILFQAMDAAGKDSTIKRVMSGINPQGVHVMSFKTPSKNELAHDYMWRCYIQLPRRGYIGLFNRSYYEDVLVVDVHDIWRGYAMPKRCLDIPKEEFFGRRYAHIKDFEEHLYENGFRVAKFFLNVSLAEQQKRFIERIDDETKNWKFSANDVAERALWPKYMETYERVINGTASEHAPWYVIPADQKWYARWLVSEALVSVLEDIDPQYPTMTDEQKSHLSEYKEKLLDIEDVEREYLGESEARRVALEARQRVERIATAEPEDSAPEKDEKKAKKPKKAKKAKKSDKADKAVKSGKAEGDKAGKASKAGKAEDDKADKAEGDKAKGDKEGDSPKSQDSTELAKKGSGAIATTPKAKSIARKENKSGVPAKRPASSRAIKVSDKASAAKESAAAKADEAKAAEANPAAATKPAASKTAAAKATAAKPAATKPAAAKTTAAKPAAAKTTAAKTTAAKPAASKTTRATATKPAPKPAAAKAAAAKPAAAEGTKASGAERPATAKKTTRTTTSKAKPATESAEATGQES